VGSDTKILAIADSSSTRVTVACAFIDKFLRDKADYWEKKGNLAKALLESCLLASDKPVILDLNAADDFAAGTQFLTVSGTSAECGDDGQTGRGNRITGLITPCRPMSMEATAGKNPMSHTGRLYQEAARLIASRLIKEIPEWTDVECILVSKIGCPITEPQFISLKVRSINDSLTTAIEEHAEAIVRSELRDLTVWWQRFVTGP
jgi:S-adenosylmethionine synthetase